MAYKVDENGNYQRTVRCSHCYEVGHNKSSCPKRKQDLKDNIARYTKELEEDNFSEPWYKENTERYLANSKEQLAKMTQKGKKRSSRTLALFLRPNPTFVSPTTLRILAIQVNSSLFLKRIRQKRLGAALPADLVTALL